MDDEHYMGLALEQAKLAYDAGEVPVGAIVVRGGKVIGRGYNQPISSCDPTAHAEVRALREAASVEGNYRVVDSTLYVTLEPCAMCVGALIHARISKLVYAASEPKAGMVASRMDMLGLEHWNHKIESVGGVRAKDSSELLQSFFKERREQKRQLKRL